LALSAGSDLSRRPDAPASTWSGTRDCVSFPGTSVHRV
jgi:hypothetical protein